MKRPLAPRRARPALRAFLLAAMLAAAPPAGAVLIEEIVAWVNDDIITRSSFEDRNQAVVEDLFGRLSGAELDRQLAEARGSLLRDMISEKLLLQQAERIYDMKKMEASLLKSFKQQEKIATDEELIALLAGEGLTLDDMKRRLVEYNAPQSVIQYEVRDKVAVSDAEVEAFYRDRKSEFAAPEEVTIREIVFLAEGRGRDEAIALARKAVEEARAGADFETLARERSEAASRERGGLLGPFRRGELEPRIEEAAFSQAPGAIGEPVVTGHGAHLIRVESRSEPDVPPLEDVRERIYDRLAREKARVQLAEYLKKLWAASEIEVSQDYLDRITPEFRRYVREAGPAVPAVR